MVGDGFVKDYPLFFYQQNNRYFRNNFVTMIVQSPLLGNQSGSSGEMVFQPYGGRTIMRSKPALFHYQPTPKKAAAQNKYYLLRSKWLPVYRQLKPYFPTTNRQGLNYFNILTSGVFKAAQTFHPYNQQDPIPRFGFDIYNRIQSKKGSISAVFSGGAYLIRLNSYTMSSNVNFTPTYIHGLMLSPALQDVQLHTINFQAAPVTFPFDNSNAWLPGNTIYLYIAFSNNEYFSDFFF